MAKSWESRVQWLGLIAGPVAAAATYFVLEAALIEPAARKTAAVAVWMGIWWLTEAISISATALLPLAAFPVLGVLPIDAAAAPYADKIVVLFMGGFLLGLAMERWGLHKRIALVTLSAVGSSPRRLVGGLLIGTAIISAWVNNTATAVVMLPIALSLVAHVRARHGAAADAFAGAAVLAVAYGASIGGIATLIGTAPNAVFKSVALNATGREVEFSQWMRAGVPLAAVILALAWAWLVHGKYRVSAIAEEADVRIVIAEQKRLLGPVTRGEWMVMTVFFSAVAFWILRTAIAKWTGWTFLTDEWIAVVAAMLMFIIPVHPSRREFMIDWKTAERLPWSVLLLFGGGLSLAKAIEKSHLDQWIGGQVAALHGVPPIVLIAAMVAMMVFLSELASNTALATAMLPVLASAAQGLNMDPLTLMIPATFACSLAFMLPAGTPPNALAFATGQVTMPRMIRSGLVLNLAACVCITLHSYYIVPLVW